MGWSQEFVFNKLMIRAGEPQEQGINFIWVSLPLNGFEFLVLFKETRK